MPSTVTPTNLGPEFEMGTVTAGKITIRGISNAASGTAAPTVAPAAHGSRWYVRTSTTPNDLFWWNGSAWMHLNPLQTALQTTIADTGGFYAATTVEAALAEIAAAQYRTQAIRKTANSTDQNLLTQGTAVEVTLANTQEVFNGAAFGSFTGNVFTCTVAGLYCIEAVGLLLNWGNGTANTSSEWYLSFGGPFTADVNIGFEYSGVPLTTGQGMVAAPDSKKVIALQVGSTVALMAKPLNGSSTPNAARVWNSVRPAELIIAKY